jgi:hypothetical protein
MKKSIYLFFLLTAYSISAYASFPINEIIEPATLLKSDSSAWGIASLICGILGFTVFPLFGIPAIVFGALGFKKKGRGLAIAGFVLGIIELIVIALIISALFLFGSGYY